MDEFELIQWIKSKAGPVPKGWIGIGDDAAVFPGRAAKNWVVSTDTIVEGVDFDRKVTPAQAGRKALAINLSDIAAMGATPNFFLMTLGIPKAWRSDQKLKKFLEGVFKLAREYRLVCVGGDMTSSTQFFCSITIWGEPAGKSAVLRSGAKPGDFILVTGTLGGSILKKHFAFTPRVREGIFLAQSGAVSALIDVSDGLAQDLSHLTRASKLRAGLNLECVPVSSAAKNLNAALSNGEDFELLLTVPQLKYGSLIQKWKKAFPKVPLTLIGVMRRGKTGIDFFMNGKKQLEFSVSAGFRHF